MVGHILQYHPAIVKLKAMIQAGELGKIRYIYSNRLNIGKLRTEENILWSFAPHDISVILMLLGEEPVRVHAFGGDYINTGVNDVTLTELEFANGVKGHVFVSWLHPFKEQKLRPPPLFAPCSNTPTARRSPWRSTVPMCQGGWWRTPPRNRTRPDASCDAVRSNCWTTESATTRM